MVGMTIKEVDSNRLATPHKSCARREAVENKFFIGEQLQSFQKCEHAGTHASLAAKHFGKTEHRPNGARRNKERKNALFNYSKDLYDDCEKVGLIQTVHHRD
ncbi:hypothetical protein M514_17066 [Trichuris suis]|uniref:Uncharacterized protein n=1 Tax=Trichuris suis TaxID=68888 RepID=A0A085NM98_9BILA|nr:hypothetical protein M514_17066 [Trichuris suis]